MSAQQHRERQRQRVDTLEGCLRERDDEIAKLREQVCVCTLELCCVSGLAGALVLLCKCVDLVCLM